MFVNTEELTATDLQPTIVKRLAQTIQNNELAHAYLLVGSTGSGKEALAQWLTLCIFCTNLQNGHPDGKCAECQRVLSGNHPDVVTAEVTGRQIKVDQIRHIKEEFTKTGMESDKKVFIINDADKMTVGAANSLLKFIEEPGPGVYIIMLTSNKNAVLPTIQSRTQVIEMMPLPRKMVNRILESVGIPQYLIPVMNGITKSPDDALSLMKDDWFSKAVNVIIEWYKELGNNDPMAFVDVQEHLIKLAGERSQQLVLLDLMALIWRDTVVLTTGIDDVNQYHFVQWLTYLKQVVTHHNVKQIVEASRVTLEGRQFLDENINFQNVCEQETLRILKVLMNKK